MQDWGHSPMTEFEIRRDRYTREAENARLVGQGMSVEKAGLERRGKLLEGLAFAVILLVLIALGAGVYLAAFPSLAIAGH